MLETSSRRMNIMKVSSLCSEGNLELFAALPPQIKKQAQIMQDFILADVVNKTENSEWRDKLFPFPYSYIQSHYWDVGFLRH